MPQPRSTTRPAGRRVIERDEVVERLLSLGAKPLVLRRVPGIALGGHRAVRSVCGVSIGGQDSVAPVRPRVWTRHVSFGKSSCANGYEHDYLVNLTLPTAGTTCPTN